MVLKITDNRFNSLKHQKYTDYKFGYKFNESKQSTSHLDISTLLQEYILKRKKCNINNLQVCKAKKYLKRNSN